MLRYFFLHRAAPWECSFPNPSREKGVLKSPQAFQNPKSKIFFPLIVRKAQRRAFPIVL